VQAGLALRHDPANARVPDIAGFLLRMGIADGLPRHLKPGHTRPGLIPCSGRRSGRRQPSPLHCAYIRA